MRTSAGTGLAAVWKPCRIPVPQAAALHVSVCLMNIMRTSGAYAGTARISLRDVLHLIIRYKDAIIHTVNPSGF